MNATRWTGMALVAALPLGLAAAYGAAIQHEDDAAPGIRVRTGEPADADAAAEERAAQGSLVRIGEREPADGFDAERWRAELTGADLDRREASYARLLEIARGSPAARQALDAWAAGTDELAWTARMARRELGRTNGFGWLGGGPSSLRGRRGAGVFGGADLEAQLRQIESMLSDLRDGGGWSHGLPHAFVPPAVPAAPGMREERQSYSIEVGPDGARIEVQEDVDGDSESRVYEGGTLDEILRANPELEDEIQVRALDLDGETLLGQLLDGDPLRLWQGVDRPGGDLALGAPPTDKLGIAFEAPSPELVDRLDLAPGQGLTVLRTVPGTIAHLLGLQRGDVVVELNQIPIYQGDDVSRVLAERLPDAPVAVTIVDSKGKRRTLTWKPASTPAPR